jgi:hypothetical protein
MMGIMIGITTGRLTTRHKNHISRLGQASEHRVSVGLRPQIGA